VDVAVWYRVGTRSEKSGKTGLSALVGRLMARGSAAAPLSAPRRLIEAAGGSASDVINPDYACFWQTVPCEAVEVALRLEADRMRSLAVAPASFEAERGALGEAQRLRLAGNPVGRALQRLYEEVYAGHPYAWPVSGAEHDIGRLTLADAEAYHRERYTPQNAVLTVVGCVDPAATLATIRALFEPLPRRSPPPLPAAPRPPATGPRRVVESASAPSPLLLVGWRGPASSDPDSPAFELLSHVVTSGPSSRIQRLREGRREFLLAQGDLDRSREASILFCITVVRSAADTALAESLLVAEVEGLAAAPVTEADLERARRKSEAALAFGTQTVRGRAQALGTAQILEGDHRAARKRIDRIRALTASDLQRAAARLLRPEARSVVWVFPDGGGGGSIGSGSRP
jgi:zinc protease